MNRAYLFFNQRIALPLAAILAFSTVVAQADSMTAFGVQYNSLGGATLSSTASGGVQVSNIGSGGNDGVQLTPLSGAAPWAQSFSLDTFIDPGAAPVGSYITETNYGPLSGGPAEVVSSMTSTQTSDGIALSVDFPNSPPGEPVTINYYSGGLDGTLVYTETTSGGMLGLTVRKAGGNQQSVESDWNYYNWPNVATTAYDSAEFFGQITTANGATLPASDDIDFIHFIAPTNLPMDNLDYSSISLTGGGGLGGFAITGEALMVPEPASILLAISALAGCAFACRQRCTRV